MKTYAIPLALVAIIMIAGVFAFSPVQTASTVHDSLADDLEEVKDTFCNTWHDSEFWVYDSETDDCINTD